MDNKAGVATYTTKTYSSKLASRITDDTLCIICQQSLAHHTSGIFLQALCASPNRPHDTFYNALHLG